MRKIALVVLAVSASTLAVLGSSIAASAKPTTPTRVALTPVCQLAHRVKPKPGETAKQLCASNPTVLTAHSSNLVKGTCGYLEIYSYPNGPNVSLSISTIGLFNVSRTSRPTQLWYASYEATYLNRNTGRVSGEGPMSIAPSSIYEAVRSRGNWKTGAGTINWTMKGFGERYDGQICAGALTASSTNQSYPSTDD